MPTDRPQSTAVAANALAHLNRAQAVETLLAAPTEFRPEVLQLLEPATAADLLEALPDDIAADAVKRMPPDVAASIVQEMQSDEEVDLLQ